MSDWFTQEHTSLQSGKPFLILFITAVDNLQDETTKCKLGLIKRETEFPGAAKPKMVVPRWGKRPLPPPTATESLPHIETESVNILILKKNLEAA